MSGMQRVSIILLFVITTLVPVGSVAQDHSSRMAPNPDEDGVLGAHRSRNLGADREAPGIGMLLIQRIDIVNRMIDQNGFRSALTELQELANYPRLSEFETAVINLLTGYVYAQTEEYDLAINHYTSALESEVLPTPTHQGALYSLAHLYASTQKYEKAIEIMLDWLQFEPDPFAEAYMFMGSNIAALEDYAGALPWMERAIEKSERPIESWYQITYTLHIELEQYDKAVPMLKSMIGYWPRISEYWKALAGLYQELGDERGTYDTTMTAYINGMLTHEQDILSLVDMTLIHDTPFAAGTILENEMIAGVVEEREATLSALIDVWIAAREYEKAIAALEKAADVSDPAFHYMRAAQLHVQSGNFEGAAHSAEKALGAGVDDRVNALVIAGSAYSELGDWDRSIAAFRQVAEIGDDDERDNAENWIRFVEESRQLTLSSLP